MRHADRELRLAGFHKDNDDKGPDDQGAPYDGLLYEAALDMLAVFVLQGHSGASAGVMHGLVERLMMYRILTSLTGADDEWNLVGGHPDHGKCYQNRRASNVFKDGDGNAYQSDFRVYREPSGITYTSRDSAERIPKFPYMPHQVYVDVPAPEEHEIPGRIVTP